jgi:hypothetical protein
MNRAIRFFTVACAAVVVALSSCSKTEEVLENNNPTTNTSTASVSFGDSYGTLAAVRSVSYTTIGGMTIPVETNTAVAAFPSGAGSSTYSDAGTVTLNSKTLTKQANNSYVYQNLTDPLTLGSVNWSVTGSGSVPAITYSYTRPIPDYSGYNSLPSSITRSAGLTVSLGSSVSGADSVYVIVSGGSGNAYLLKRLAGNASQAVFTASDLNSLGTGTGMIQVAPWNYTSQEFGGKKIYFVNESAYSKIGVTIN